MTTRAQQMAREITRYDRAPKKSLEAIAEVAYRRGLEDAVAALKNKHDGDWPTIIDCEQRIRALADEEIDLGQTQEG